MPVPYPLIRALLPLCLGIWVGDCYPLSTEHLLLWGGLTGALLLLAMAYGIERHRVRSSCRLGTTTCCDLPLLTGAFVLAGAALATSQRPVAPPSSTVNQRTATGNYLFELLTPPKERPRTYVCQARLLAQTAATDSTGYISESGRCQLTDEAIAKIDAAQAELKAGKIVPAANFNGITPETFTW